ncbi:MULTISPECIES: type IVB secretion system protein IcmH/DotU [Helicobacter]|uniref:type IVB secretion system protein IcmH/DotU n=1 Tax=Helicobacter TaxID=209 RepID=UPI0005142C4A|nr:MULTISPECIES: type IVB secretion system protein IcmH/DotU [Helicobacter]TLD86147.1 DotU family type IV/VI secretion system protein [Helicobacter sp. MIT 03-1614]
MNTEQELSLLLETNFANHCNNMQNNKILHLTLPLLLFATRLSKTGTLDDSYITNTEETFANEILSIGSNLNALRCYEDKDLIKLRYCLCVFIDEMLLHNESFINSHFAKHTLTIRLFDEMLGGDKFYGIANQWLLTPSKHKDMLEFIYTCLILGYQGKYASDTQGKQKINHLCCNIANSLAPAMGSSEEKAFELALNHQEQTRILKLLHKKYLRPFWLMAIICSIVALFFLFSFLKLESQKAITQDTLKQNLQHFKVSPHED